MHQLVGVVQMLGPGHHRGLKMLHAGDNTLWQTDSAGQSKEGVHDEVMAN